MTEKHRELAERIWRYECGGPVPPTEPTALADFEHMVAECATFERDVRAEALREKPCYCLGRHTIERVANEGQLDTERVAFVAADDLFHKNPYGSRVSSCECGQALLDWMQDCHMCGRKRAALAAPKVASRCTQERD